MRDKEDQSRWQKKVNLDLKHGAQEARGSCQQVAAELDMHPAQFSQICIGLRKPTAEQLRRLKTILSPERFARAFPEKSKAKVEKAA